MSNLSDLLGGAVSNVEDVETVTSSSSDPAADTNPSATGYIWINTTSGEVYVCTDATSGGNVWTNMGDGADSVRPSPIGERGVLGGGMTAVNVDVATYSYFTISSTNAVASFGNLTNSNGVREGAMCQGQGRGIFSGGYDYTTSSNQNTIEYITVSTTGNGTDFGDLSNTQLRHGALSNGVRGIVSAGGRYGNTYDKSEYVTISTTGNATHFGNLLGGDEHTDGCSDGSRGLLGGGEGSGNNQRIQYVNISTTQDWSDFGDLTIARGWGGGAAISNDTRALFAGGATGGTWKNEIEYVTVATTGNATDFGDLGFGVWNAAGCCNSTRAVFAGGEGSYYYHRNQYVTIATTGNATHYNAWSSGATHMGSCSGD